MEYSGEREPVTYNHPPWFRPWCPCCVERGKRPGYTTSKATSRKQSIKARRSSHGVSKRLRREARREKIE